MSTLFKEKEEVVEPPHPFDSIFGKNVNKKIQEAGKKTTSIGITY